ncbi:MAG: oligosaccharide flippase family protein, partial [Gammaproteobacteria bacterium]|nr:oligosaccharide flippase family protein [Gammaproteobacteria bacterium]
MKRGLSRVSGELRGNGLRARLVRSALGSAGVQAANRAIALVLGVVLARSLGPDGYGVYAFAFALMSLLMVAAEAGVPTLLMREVAAAEGSGDWGLLRGALQRGVQFVGLVSLTIAVSGLVVLVLFADRVAP